MGPSDANYGWESKKKVIPIDKKEQRPSFVSSREVVVFPSAHVQNERAQKQQLQKNF